MSFNVVDVRNINVVEVLKTKWLHLGFVNASEGSVVESSLCDLFLSYSQCYQFPVLIAKLFTAIKEVITQASGGVFYNRGYIPTSLLKAFPQCVMSLPNAQALKLWQQFLDDVKDLIMYAEHGVSFQAGAFIAAQLFSAFLTHINLLDMLNAESLRTEIQKLMQQTEEISELHSAAFDVDNTNTHVLQISMLLIKSSFRRLKSFHYSVSEASLKLTESKVCCGFSFLPTHDSIGCDALQLCQPYLEAEDKRLCFCMMNLLKEEMVSILLCLHGNMKIEADDKKRLNAIMSMLTDTTISSLQSGLSSPWDVNINILDEKNYSTGAVISYVGHLPLALNFVDAKQLALFCSTAIDMLMHPSGSKMNKISVHKALDAFFRSGFFTESKKLQNAFVTAVWERARLLLDDKTSEPAAEPYSILTLLCSSKNKWNKYSFTTPKKSIKLSSMWTMVKEIAVRLNDLLMQDTPETVSKIDVSNVINLIKVLNYLPLEFLSPGNQMRCLYGLSLLLILMKNPLNSGHSDSLKADKEIIDSLNSIFESVRSIWLFDFIEPVPYIKAVVAIISNIESADPSESSNRNKLLLSKLFNLATKTEPLLLKLEEYFNELSDGMTDSVASAMAFNSLLERIAQLLKHTNLQPQCKEACIRLAMKCCSSVASQVKHNHKLMPNMKTFSLFLRAYTILLELIAHPNTASLFAKKEKLLKWLPHIVDKTFEEFEKVAVDAGFEEIFHFVSTVLAHQKEFSGYLPEEICYRSWKTLKPVFFSKSRIIVDAQMALLKNVEHSCVSKPGAIHFACRIKPSGSQLEMSMDHVLSEIENLPTALTNDLSTVISTIIQQSSEEELQSIFKDVFTEMKVDILDVEVLDVGQFQMQICIIKAVLDAALESNKLHAVMPMMQNWMSNLHFLLNQTCPSPRCLITIIIPSLNFIASLLSKKSEKLKLPRQLVIQCLHCTVPVDVSSYVDQPVLFIQAYQAVWKILSLLLANHCFITLSCRIAYMPCVTRLLKAAVQASNQDFILKCEENVAQKVLQCVDNLRRLFTSITKNETEFAKMVPYLVADYVDAVQNVTLHPTAKSHFLAGMHRLLDICSEDSLKMLSANVTHSCREILHNLVKSYKMFRFVGQV